MGKHDFHHDTKHTLPHQYMPHCLINVVFLRLTSGNEVTIMKLHGLCTLCTEFATDNDLA